MAKVELRNVWKLYGKLRAVKGISFTCLDKTLTVILGPSGAGKTSTLKMIAGIEEVTHGEILIDGEDVKNVEPEDRDIAMVFESYALYTRISVFENIAFPLRAPIRAKNYTEDDIRERVVSVAKLLHIDHLLDRKPVELSGGQRQRVAMGRALVRNPRVLLLDEPIAHLDAKLRNQMRGEFRALAHKLDTTVIYVTHDYREALAIADNIIILNKGEIQQMAPPKEIFENPATDFVADLVGDPPMNLLDCDIMDEGSNRFLVLEDTKIRLNEKQAQDVERLKTKDSRIRLGVRPVDVKVNGGENSESIPAEVYVIEPLGKQNILTFKVGNNTLIQSVAPSSFRPSMGDKVWLNFEKIHIFTPTIKLENGKTA